MKKKIFFILLAAIFTFRLTAQTQADTLIIVSYNVENFFDAQHDSLKNDYEFLPEGNYHWTSAKYKQKQANIARVIASIGGWNTPALVGLVEVENEKTLVALTKYSPLKNRKYKFIHKESPDARGIDVALLYQPSVFKPIKEDFLEINFPDNPRSKTRDLLYAVGTLPNQDTLHVFVAHFPSRLGGQATSEPRRIFVASVLRAKVDSIFAASPRANIVLMGDFNDYPGDKSILTTLNAIKPEGEIKPQQLYNLYYRFYEKGEKGSHKFQGIWGMLDQIMVSGNLIMPENKTFTDRDNAQIYDADFLLEDDARYLGKQPFRTNIGMRFNGGYSDHLPIYINLIIKNE